MMTNIVSTITGALALSFASFTLLSHFVVFSGGSFDALTNLAAPALLFGALFHLALSRDRAALDNGAILPTPSGTQYDPPTLIWIVIPALMVAGYWISGRYDVFWLVSMIYAVLAVRRVWTPNPDQSQSPMTVTVSAWALLAGACVIAALITLIAHRPDHDDAFFTSIGATALTHPTESLLSKDTMHADPGLGLPLVSPVYKVNSIELLSAVLARFFGGDLLIYAHIVLPAFLAVVMILGWAFLMQELTPRYWAVGTVVVLLFALLLGENHWGFGNFAFVRLHQGKAALVSIAVPLAFAFAWRFVRRGGRADLLALTATIISAIGLSSAALFTMPLVIGGAAVSAWRPRFTRRCIAILVPLAYPLLLALILRSSMMATSDYWTGPHERTSEITAAVFGPVSQQYLVLFAILAAWTLASHRDAGSKLAVLMLFALCVPMNPFLAATISKYVTTPIAYWRVLWCIPIYVFCAFIVVGLFERFFAVGGTTGSKGVVATAVVVLGFAGWTAPLHILRESNGVTLRWPPEPKIEHPEYEIAQRLLPLTTVGHSILAPEALAVWLTSRPNHPPLVIVRKSYVRSMRSYLDRQDWEDRLRMAKVLGGDEAATGADAEAMSRIVARNVVGTVAMHVSAIEVLGPRLHQLGFEERIAEGNYVAFGNQLSPR